MTVVKTSLMAHYSQQNKIILFWQELLKTTLNLSQFLLHRPNNVKWSHCLKFENAKLTVRLKRWNASFYNSKIYWKITHFVQEYVKRRIFQPSDLCTNYFWSISTHNFPRLNLQNVAKNQGWDSTVLMRGRGIKKLETPRLRYRFI